MKKSLLISIPIITEILFCTVFFSFTSVFAQSPNWLWAKSAQGPGGHGDGWAIHTDVNGNVLATGFFDGQITFGTTVLTSAGGYDMFIVKYDPSGNVLWAKSEGGIADDKGAGISTDANGNVIVTGSFEDSSLTIGSTILTNYGGADIFLAKYDASGNPLWAKGAGLNSADLANSICTDANDNIIIVGEFWSPFLAFGSWFLTNSNTQMPYANMFIAKYDPSGNVLWAYSAGGSGGGVGDYFWGVSTDQNNNILVSGGFSSLAVTFGSTVLTNSTGNTRMVVVKYDPAGNVLWATSGTGSPTSAAYGIDTDADNNVYVTGRYDMQISLDSIVLNYSGATIFIAKYDSSGNVLWAKSASGAGGWGYGLSSDDAGNSYIVGFTGSAITFGTITVTPPQGSNFLMFIVNYDPGGNAQCATLLESADQWINAVTADPSGNAYVIGDYDVNPFVVGNDTLTLTGVQDVFVGKFTCSATGINEPADQSVKFKIVPNPFKDEFTIPGLQAYKFPAEIKIRDVFGRIVYYQKLLSYDCKVRTANWQAGLYLLEFVSEDGQRIIKKMIKE